VVDGNWVTDHTAPQENDASGNLNNVLTTERIVKHTPATAGIMSSVGPTSTTAESAKDIPLEHTGSSDLPGSFPETPAAVDTEEFSVNPLPAAPGAVNPIKLAPGEKVPHPSEFTSSTVTSGVYDDPELVAADKAKGESEQTFSVAPLPAFPGAVNPVKVAPGEKIPESSTLTGNTISSNVRTDKESYENSGAFGNAPVLPPVVTPQSERDQKGTGILDLPPVSKNLIPESSLPMGAAGAGTYNASPLIQSSGAQSTTAQLAGAVPLESSKVPKVVKESQEEAGVAPEASAVPEEVKEKSAVEKELLGEVPVAPSTSEGTGGKETSDKSENGVSGGEVAAAVGGAAVAYASGAASKLPESVTSKLPESVQNSINNINSTSNTDSAAPAKDTPEVVKESLAESGQPPEAAANEEAVLEKKAVEKELLSEVKPDTSTGESAPKISEGLAAPATPSKLIESRDVSPGTVPGSHTEVQIAPLVTSGVGSATTDKTTTASSTPAKSTAGSSKAADSPASASAADKKKKRTSIFGKLKAKFSDKHKE
jgi:hypothetical protein